MDRLRLKLRKLNQFILFYPWVVAVANIGCVSEPKQPKDIIPRCIMVKAIAKAVTVCPDGEAIIDIYFHTFYKMKRKTLI